MAALSAMRAIRTRPSTREATPKPATASWPNCATWYVMNAVVTGAIRLLAIDGRPTCRMRRHESNILSDPQVLERDQVFL